MNGLSSKIILGVIVGIFVGVLAGVVTGLLGYPGWVVGPIVGIAAPILLLSLRRKRGV